MGTDPNFFQSLISNDIFNIITAVVALAAAIAAVTPTKADNFWIDKLLSLLNALGLNFGKAKNADDVK